ncbi:MAG: hypothetical protein AAGL97_03625 [Pseudomonadota bacterium]
MNEPSLDLEKPNAVGALDRVTTNVAMSLIAVVPTFLTCIVAPWRLSELLKRDDPEGRLGMRLAPGAFFPLALLLSMIAGALLTTPELANRNGAFLGPNLALAIQSAISEGDIWRTVGTVLPIYAFAVVAGSLGALLNRWAHEDWGLRVSLRAAFYVVGAFVSWVILSTAAIDLVRASTQNFQLANTLSVVITVPSLVAIVWMYFWFFRNGGDISWIRSGLLTIAMMVLLLITMVLVGVLASF